MLEGTVSKNFTFKEMSCKCGCGTRNVSKEAIRKLQAMRDALRHPLVINSAARCPRHNKDVGGAPKSRHLSTKDQASDAFDIALVGNILSAKDIIEAALNAGFKGIGVANTFIHVDDRPDYANWNY